MPAHGLEPLEPLRVSPELLQAVEEGGVRAASPLDELPQFPRLDRLPDPPDLREGDVQVVLREGALVPLQFLRGVGRAHRTLAVRELEFRGMAGPVDEHHPPGPRVLRVRGGVEEVAAEEGR